MQTAPLPSAALAEFYRFALLLTGDARCAEQVLAETLAEAESQIGQLRKDTSRHAWMATHLRERCLKNNGFTAAEPVAGLDTESEEKSRSSGIAPAVIARRFHQLPEPERSALALFYLELFSTGEIAQLLKMEPDLLSETLAAARGLLQQSLRAELA